MATDSMPYYPEQYDYNAAPANYALGYVVGEVQDDAPIEDNRQGKEHPPR